MSDKNTDFEQHDGFDPSDFMDETDTPDLAQDAIRDAMMSDDDDGNPSDFMMDLDREMGLETQDTADTEMGSNFPHQNQADTEVVVTKDKLDLIMSILRSLVDAVETIEVRLDNHRDAIETSRAQIESIDGTLRILFEHIEKSIR